MARPDPIKLPELDNFSVKQLHELRDWLAGCREVFKRGQERCLDAYRECPVTSLLTNADYYSNCASGTGFMLAQVTKKISRKLRLIKESEDGSKGPSASGK